MIYVYALVDPESGNPRYIGKTNHPKFRLLSHISNAKWCRSDTHCARWIRTLLARNIRPIMLILAEIPDGGDWQSIEMEQIVKHRSMGHQLTNLTNGGDGPGCMPGEAVYNHSEAMKRAFSDPEVKERYRRGTINSWQDPVIRKKRLAAMNTEEFKKKQSDGTRRQFQDPSQRTRLSATLRELWNSPHRKLEQSIKAKNAWKENWSQMASIIRAACTTPEHRAKMREINKEINNRPEVRLQRSMPRGSATPERKAKTAAKLKEIHATRPELWANVSAKMKAIYADPIAGAKRRAIAASPEVRQKISEATKLTRSNPEERARMSERAKEAQSRPEVKALRSAAMKEWWSDPENNKRMRESFSDHVLTISGRTQSLMEWSKESGIGYTTILRRLKQGMDPSAAVFTTPNTMQRPKATDERKRKIAAKLRASWAKRKAK